MTAAVGKLCVRCKKDVSAAKSFKDTKGNVYCEGCYKAALQQKQQQQQTSAAAPATPRPPQRTVTRVAPPPPPAPTPESSAPKKLPDFCPACNAPVLPNRKICIKCNRDLTKMDKLLALRAEQSKVTADERIGNIIGKTIKFALIVVAAGAIGFVAYGGWIMLHPGTPFDDYPLKRADAVQNLLTDISEGTDKSYEAAFKLITLRVRTTANPNEAGLYKMVDAHMHDDFLQKYGPDWLSKAKIESEEPGSTSELVPFAVTINGDTYHVIVQAQMSAEAAIENMVSRGPALEFLENGKRHFGIYKIDEYDAHPPAKDKMEGGGFPPLKPLKEINNDPNAPQ